MMRLAFATALFLLTSINAGWAQSVLVRAGEHAEFTRIVFNVPGRMDVGLTYRENGVDLRFDRDSLRFQTDTVFDLIPQTRLTGVEITPGGAGSEGGAGRSIISLSLDCRCDIQTSWAGDRAFVVDIRDETELSAALFPAPAIDPTARPEMTDFFPDPLPVGPALAEPAEPVQRATPSPAEPADTALSLLSKDEQPSLGSVAFLLADAEDRLQKLRPAPVEPPNAYVDRVRESQGAILQQIGRAATQGLLEPRVNILPDPSEPAPAPEPEPAQTTRGAIATAPPDGEDNITISAQTSMDQAISERLNITLGDGQTPGCMDPKRVDAASWAEDDSFVTQIGELRSNIIGEFDEPSAAAIKKLARFYIHFGFGLEAKQVMTLLPEGKTPDAALLAMINILEQGHDGQNSVLAGYMDCDPLLAVWSLLSYDKVPGNEPIDPDGIVRGVMAFPVHLRTHLGPIVGEKLRVAGYPGAADHIARVLLRNDDTTSTAATYLDTLNDATGPDALPSEAGLGEVIADNSQPSAEALLKLIDARLIEDSPMSEEMAELAGAYATELRDVPMGKDMARAYVLALAASGAFEQAFSEFARLMTTAPMPIDGTLSELFGLLAKKSDDPTFLTQAIGAPSSTRFALDDTVGNAVATRLMALGFPDQASAFVAPMAQGAAERTRKLIRAEIALMTDRPRQAELEVLGESGDDVMQIIARARSMSGEHSAAQDIYTDLNAEEEAERQAFLDGDWDRLQNASDPVIAAVADRQTAPTPEEEVDQVLARNSAMIEDSQTMRAEIEALLSGTAIPTASDP